MTPVEFRALAVKIFGRKRMALQVAAALAVDKTTVHRLMKRQEVPGPYVVALQGLWENAKRQRELEAAARRLMPKLKREAKKK